MTNQEIHNICKEYNITNYTINRDGSIDVDGGVDLSYMDLTEIPLKFNKVSGSFYCHDNQLKSLVGGPKEVGRNFDCYNNHLTSLERSPIELGGSFYCYKNQLTSLEGYNGEYDKLYCNNKDGLILKLKRKQKLKLINEL